jgi:hypothetical protein
MADLPVTPLANYGQLLSSLPLADSEIASQSAAQNLNRAQTAQVQATTQGTNIANQGAQLSLDALKQAYGGGVPTVNQPSTIGGTGVGTDDVTQHAIDKFAPLPTKPPAALQQQAYMLSMGGKPDAAKGLLDMYATQVAGANQQRQLAANQSYQTAETVASAPPGAAFETLSRVNPEAAAGLKAKYPNASADELDADVRQFAQHIGIATHQYSGRDTEFQNGVLVDKKDGKPVLGAEQVLTGLDAKGKEGAFSSANELVTVHNSDGSDTQVPRWQQAGYHSAESYVIAADKNARSSANNAPPPSGNTASTAGPPKAVTAPVKPASVTTDPVLKDALADPDYKIKTPPIVAGRTPTPAELDQQKATVQARTDLLSNAQEATNTGAQALQYMNAAKAIMESKGAPVTGPLGGLVAKLTSPFGSVDATNYQEAAKYLGNAAIQAGKGNFGKGMTQNDVQLQKDELSPSVHMTDGALKDLINAGIKNTQYTLDSAKRVRPYLATGGDPQSYAEWNDKHFSRTDAVNTPKPDAGGIPSAGIVRGGYKFLGGDPSVKANWSKQ